MRKILLFSLLVLSLQAKSQSNGPTITPATLNIGGGSAKINSSFILDWSIGESTIIETFQGENLYSNSVIGTKWNVTSGILQPFDKNYMIFNPQVPLWTNQEVRIFPVPTPNMVYVEFRSVAKGKISIQLMTFEGRIIGSKEIMQVNGSSTQSWNIKNYPSGIYYFKILLSSDEGKILKQGTFKIEKIQ